MIPVRLTISGFLSYQEPAEIDFTGLHVACITGRNGAGKSTMLDAMTWALFGEARKNDDSVINDSVPDRTAKVDFEFRYENAFYLVRRQKTKGKSTVLEFYIRNGDSGPWKPLTEKKLADTNRRICETLRMDYKTFINASFFLQGKADQFTGQNASERKKILSNILNLDVWEEYKAEASERRKAAELSIGQLDRLIRESEAELAEGPARREKLEAVRCRLGEAEKVLTNAEALWKTAQAALSSLNALKNVLDQKVLSEDRQARQLRMDQGTLEVRQKELNELRGRLAGAESIRQRYEQMVETRERMEQLNSMALRANRLEMERSGAENAIRTAEKQLQYEYKQLLREKEELEKQLPEKERLTAELAKANAELKSLTEQVSGKDKLQERFDSVSELGNKMRIDAQLMETRIRETEAKIAKLRSSQGAVCPTCGREMDAEHCQKHEAELREEIRQYRQKIAENETARVPIRKEFCDLKQEIQRLDSLQGRITDLKVAAGTAGQKLHFLTERQQNWENKKERFSEIERSLRDADFCPDERETLRRAEAEITALAYDRKEHEAVRAQLGELAGAEAEHQEMIRSQSRIEPLERDISERKAAVTAGTEHLQALREEREKAEAEYQELKAKMPDITAAEKARDNAADVRNRLYIELGTAEQQVRSLDQAKANLDRYGSEFREKRVLAERYKTLEKAFGKDGVPALLIEQAVPEIEELANDLLQQLSGGTMSLTMNTQGAYKSKKDEVKETLDIMISDPYGTRAYEMFSGGEAFRINFSVRLALSRLLAQRAGSRLQTLVIDEGFGSQDDEGRARLAEAIAAVQNDFEKILVITHLSELKEAFPSRIEVEKTASGSRAEVIP